MKSSTLLLLLPFLLGLCTIGSTENPKISCYVCGTGLTPGSCDPLPLEPQEGCTMCTLIIFDGKETRNCFRIPQIPEDAPFKCTSFRGNVDCWCKTDRCNKNATTAGYSGSGHFTGVVWITAIPIVVLFLF